MKETFLLGKVSDVIIYSQIDKQYPFSQSISRKHFVAVYKSYVYGCEGGGVGEGEQFGCLS